MNPDDSTEPIDLSELGLPPVTDTVNIEFVPEDEAEPITISELEVDFCVHPSKTFPKSIPTKFTVFQLDLFLILGKCIYPQLLILTQRQHK